MEEVLGKMNVHVDMMGGRQPYLLAAMKSLPLREDNTPVYSTLAERRLVNHLITDCSKQLEGTPYHWQRSLAPSVNATV